MQVKATETRFGKWDRKNNTLQRDICLLATLRHLNLRAMTPLAIRIDSAQTVEVDLNLHVTNLRLTNKDQAMEQLTLLKFNKDIWYDFFFEHFFPNFFVYFAQIAARLKDIKENNTIPDKNNSKYIQPKVIRVNALKATKRLLNLEKIRQHKVIKHLLNFEAVEQIR